MTDLKAHLIQALQKNMRFDGRQLLQYRPVSIETDISKNAEGSARVKIGETEVLAGVKFEIGSPFPDKPDEGTIIVNAELLPLSNPEFESGPPNIHSIELARVVDRGIRESKTIDFKSLCVEKGEKVWLVLIDIITINDAGNLFDAAALAAYAALQNAVFPGLDGDKINYKEKTKKKFDLMNIPVSVTVLKLGKNYFVDPTNEEEEVADARLTLVSMENGKLCAMQKGGDDPLTSMA